MRFLVVSDIHGDKVYLERLDDEFAQADAVLCAGDFARFGASETGLPILNTLVQKHDSLYCVIGNCDEPAFLLELENLDVSVQGDLVFRDGFVFAGSGGGLKFTGITPFERSEEELVRDLQLSAEHKKSDNLILIAHHPPLETKLDTLSNGMHAGSKLIRDFIIAHKPLVVISGHIHESFAVDKLGSSVLVNPGSLAEGRYAVLELERENGVWVVTRAELKKLDTAESLAD